MKMLFIYYYICLLLFVDLNVCYNDDNYHNMGHQIQSKQIPNMEIIVISSQHFQPVFRVVVNRTRLGNELYIGARNAIYKYSTSDLQKLDEYITGPVNDSINCLPPPNYCNYTRHLTDNDNKVLLINRFNDNYQTILACGNVHQGMCHLIKADNMSYARTIGSSNNNANFISGRGTTVAYFVDHPKVLFVANSYDGRPDDFISDQVSSKFIRKTGFQLYSDENAAYSRIEFQPQFKKTSNVKYLYGFSHDGFSYFLTVQPINPLKPNLYETRLARVCQFDPTFFSYTEIPLECYEKKIDNNDNSNEVLYEVATTAFFGKIGKRRHVQTNINYAEEADTLFVTFSKFSPETIWNHTSGSAICAFSMNKIKKAFTSAVKDCYNGDHRSRSIKTIIDRGCQEQNQEINDKFCDFGINRYIEGSEPLKGDFMKSIPDHVTSLAVAVQGNYQESIAAIGTNEGKIMKIRLEEPTAKPLFDLQISNKEIRPDPAFDYQQKYLYLLSGDQLIKFPFGSCSLHTDCSSCLGIIDPLNCSWCGSYCASSNECNDTMTNQCPPEIFEFTPTSGPIAGGTEITITGDNLGESGQSEENTQIKIKVAGIDCHVFEWEMRRVKCRTEKVEKSISGRLVIYVKDLALFNQGKRYDINGTVTSQQDFDFLDPQIFGINPSYGPFAGGTNVTIYGKNLHVGSKRKILLSGIECKEFSNYGTYLNCKTGQYNLTKKDPSLDTSIKLFIDNVELIVNNNKTFRDDKNKQMEWSEYYQYKPDPLVTTIEHKATIASGNTSLLVIGKNLNSVAHPRMFIVLSKISIKQTRIYIECTTRPNGELMICPTPKLPHEFTPKSAKLPLTTYVSFVMDGVQSLKHYYETNPEMSKLIYYPDPTFHKFNETRIIFKEEPILRIDGHNLSDEYKHVLNITIDNKVPCRVESMVGFEAIFCRVNFDETILSDDEQYSVHISISHIEIIIGHIKFVPKPDVKITFGFILLTVFLPVFLLAAVFFAVYLRFFKKGHFIKEPLVRYTTQESETDGFQRQGSQNEYHGNCNQPLLPGQIRVINGAATPFYQVDEEIMQLLQEEHILIQRDSLTLSHEIGQGHFGCVYKGLLENVDKEMSRDVAVKTINTALAHNELDINAFLREGLMMKDFMHDNVLTLIGVCLDNDGSPMVILPFMSHGDLLSYIRNEQNQPTVKDLLMYAIQVAEGMKYLSSLKFVHRDLAARNCMLDDDLMVKVADFGLSRDVYEREYYSSDNKKTKLPVKWMAPESLEKGAYNTKTDVWSYGVLVWELLTRGVTPYPDVDNWDILNYLKKGRRMPCPWHCPVEIYYILLKCWHEDPKSRPTFAELVDEITTTISNLEEKSRQIKVTTDITYVNLPVSPDYYNDIAAIKKDFENYAKNDKPQDFYSSNQLNQKHEYETTC